MRASISCFDQSRYPSTPALVPDRQNVFHAPLSLLFTMCSALTSTSPPNAPLHPVVGTDLSFSTSPPKYF
jgi:hypothetical protein